MEGSIRAEGYGAAHHVAPRAGARPDAGVVGVLRSAADQRARTAREISTAIAESDPAAPVSRAPRRPGAPPHAQCRCVRPVPAGAVPVESAPARDQQPGDRSVTSARSCSTRTTAARVVRHRQRLAASPIQLATCLPPDRRPRTRGGSRTRCGPTRAWPRRRPRWGSSPSTSTGTGPAAEAALRRAIALDPDTTSSHRYPGHVLSQSGRQDEAKAVILSPRTRAGPVLRDEPCGCRRSSRSGPRSRVGRPARAAGRRCRSRVLDRPTSSWDRRRSGWAGPTLRSRAFQRCEPASPERQRQDDGLQGPRPRPDGACGRGSATSCGRSNPCRESATSPVIPSRSSAGGPGASGTRPWPRSTAASRHADVRSGLPAGRSQMGRLQVRSPVQGPRRALRLCQGER